MIRIAPRARRITTLLALVLLAPVLGIRLQDPAALQAFHTRTLAPWPPSAAFASDPPAYFRQTRAWLADRAWPIEAAVALQKRILYFGLASPPARKVTIGLDGHLFLNNWNEEEGGKLLESLCVHAHGAAAQRGLTRALSQLADYARHRGTPVDVVIAPTTATLYASHLPPTVSRRLRDACGAVAAGRTTLRELAAPSGIRFVYPFDALQPYLDDPAFFPRNHWHASGKSLVVLRNAWLATLGDVPAIGESVEPALEPAEVLSMSGVVDPQPSYAVRNPSVRRDAVRETAFRAAVADLFTTPTFVANVYTNADAPRGEALLVVSDSYGQLASEVFAGAFADVVQVTTNELPLGNVAALIDRAAAVHRVDRVLLLFQEGSIDRPINYARVLQRAASAAPVAPAPPPR